MEAKKGIYILFKKYLSKIPPEVLIVVFIQSGFIIIFRLHSKIDLFSIEGLIKTFLTISVTFWLSTIILSKSKKTAVIRIFLIYLYLFLILYHYHTRTSVDFTILWNYKEELFYSEILQMIYNTMTINTLLFLSVFTILILLSQFKWKLFSKNTFSKNRISQLIIILITFGTLYVVPVKSQDEISLLSQSFINWYRIKNIFSDKTYESIPQFPYVNHAAPAFSIKEEKNLPNIFFIVIESFNAHFVEKKTNAGKEITPFFNSLIPKGIYLEHFYSNSVITVKGHLSLLFSILPSFRGTVFENYASIHLQSLPKILKNFGYETIYYQGAMSLKFQNEGPFLLKNGFDLCKAARSNRNEDIASWHPDYPKGGWGGFEDNVLYKQFFNTLDSLHNNKVFKDKKYFGFLATISSHRPFLRRGYNPVLPYPNANKIEEDFANVIYRVDTYLRLFFQEFSKRQYLKNSVIIITGDHSLPANEHGTILNAVNLYDENCKVPFLMLWFNKIHPARLKENAWSQIDVAPTILDLLNIHTANHFMGKSFINKFEGKNIVHLVQPYSGLFFSTIMYPYKYVVSISNDEEFLYNLFTDPEEKHNIIENIDEKKLSILKTEIDQFAINQYLIENNRIWRKF